MTDDVQRRWEQGCQRLAMFQAKDPVPMFRAEPVLAAAIRSLAGRDKAALRVAAHDVLDRHLRDWVERMGAWQAGISKIQPYGVEVDGLPLRLRTNDTRGIVVDVIGQGGMLCDNDLILDSVLPDSVLPSLIGRRADEIMAVPRGLFDGTRTIASTHIRFRRNTVLRLAKVTQVGVVYRDLFGSPLRRFPPLQMPTAPRRRPTHP